MLCMYSRKLEVNLFCNNSVQFSRVLQEYNIRVFHYSFVSAFSVLIYNKIISQGSIK